MDIYSYIMWVL